MKKYMVILCFVLGAVFSACDDFFETTLDIDPPEHTAQMAVHAFFTEGNKQLLLSISRSYGILENSGAYEKQFIDDATVLLYKQGELLDTIRPLSEVIPSSENLLPINYGAELDEPLTALGDSLELVITHPDYPQLSAVQHMPKQVVMPTAAKYEKDGTTDQETGERLNAVKITFVDPADEENFYEVLVAYVYEVDDQVFYNSLHSITANPLTVSGAGNSQLLSDKSFNGGEVTFEIGLWDDPQDEDEVVVLFRSITKDRFLFSKSLYDFSVGVEFELFSEPVTVYSNVQGGLGIFALGTETIFPVEK